MIPLFPLLSPKMKARNFPGAPSCLPGVCLPAAGDADQRKPLRNRGKVGKRDESRNCCQMETKLNEIHYKRVRKNL